MTAIADLNTAWTAKIATISDTLIQAEATLILETYIAALPQQAALLSGNVSSYSIAGRSFTKRDAANGQQLIDTYRRELFRAVYGDVSLMDMNTELAEPQSI